MRPAQRCAATGAFLLAAAAAGSGCRLGPPPRVLTGLEVLKARGFAELEGKRVAVIANPTSCDGRLEPLPALLAAAGVDLQAIFAPEHGLQGAQAAGESVGDGRDPLSGAPVRSLYGATRRPTREMLEGIDVVLFDVQDIGVRTYTYLATLAETLRAAAESGVEVWVLDRPVPIGGEIVEGPVLEPGFESFVGPHRLPLRHGLTAGEFALMVSAEQRIGARLRVVAMEGWRRAAPIEDAGLVWVPPSPNIPTLDAALVYAGMVLLEGTSLSEGRGTALPFQLVGAPWVDPHALACELNALRLPGCLFRPARFTPSASKHQGALCGGVQVHVTDRRAYPSVKTAVALLLAVRRLHPGKLELRTEIFDRLAGTRALREAIERDAALEEIVAGWRDALDAYRRRRERFLLYR
ncbi:MAG: DUF1343 domain-containing protein [Planctomycetes bacterium]|nr:DUF1343 domain-containing protein [Planctomycetota bacterium]